MWTSQTAWVLDIKVGKQLISFKLDTGVEVTAISHYTYMKMSDVASHLIESFMVPQGNAYRP